MRPLRAIVELALAALAFLAGNVVVVLALMWCQVDDRRWLNVAATGGGGVAALLTCVLLLRLAGHDGQSIGWTAERLPGNLGIGLAALLLADVGLLAAGLVAIMLNPDLMTHPPTAQQAIEQTLPRTSFGPLLLMMLLVVLWEEVVFRGFVLTRLQAMLKRWWLTVPASAIAFGLIHLYQGPLAVAIIASLALVMGTLFAWRRSLVPSMVFHLLNNLLVVLLLQHVSSTWR